MKKIAVVTPYVPPNIIKLYEILQKEIEDEGNILKIFCVKHKPIHRNHDIPNYGNLNIDFYDGLNFYLPKSEIAIDFPKGMSKSLRDFMPDAVIYDGYGIGFIGPIFYGLLQKLFNKKVRLIFWNSNTAKNSGPLESSNRFDKKILSFFVRKLKIFLMKFFDFYAAGGTSMIDYLTDLNVNSSLITLVPRATFTKEDITRISELSLAKKDSNNINFIYCGEISKRKGVDIIINAVKNNEKLLNNNVIIKLYGNFKHSEELYFREKIANNQKVSYMGWLNPKDLMPQIANSDVLLMPSRREPFGRIAIEALACGVFIIMADTVGSSADLNENFLSKTFLNHNPEELYKLIEESVLNIAEIRKQRELRINWVKENWTHEVSARGLMKTINFN